MKMHNGILLSHKKNEISPFAITLMDIEGTMLREISQTDTTWFHLSVESKKQNKQTSNIETNS